MTQVTTLSGQVITSQQVLAFAVSVGNDVKMVAAKANEVGLNNEAGKKFLAEVFKTDIGVVNNYLDSNRSVPSDHEASAALQGGSNNAVQTGGDPNAVTRHVIALTSSQAAVALKVLHGAGNDKVPPEDVAMWFSSGSKTPEQVLEAMIAHGISAEQLGRALALTPQRVNELLVEHGLDRQTLAAKEVESWTPANYESAVGGIADKQDEVKTTQSGLTVEANRIEPLMQEARDAQDVAAEAKSAYDQLNAKFEPAFNEYTRMSQELATLESTVQSEQGQKAAGQATLANLGAIDEDRDRRATAEREALYQIANADQKIADAQPRMEAIRAQLRDMEVWGVPLMQQTQAAKTYWEQVNQAAVQKGGVAAAQSGLALHASNQYKGAVSDLISTHEKIGIYLRSNPDLAGAEEAKRALQGTVDILNQAHAQQREWSDAAHAVGMALDQSATQLETSAAALTPALDQVMPARIMAETDIAKSQQTYDIAKSRESQAQVDLDAAYAQRDQANYAKGKGGRNRARDEANRLVELRAAELADATQNRIAAEAALGQSKAVGHVAIAATFDADAQWRGATTLAESARNQSFVELGIASQFMDLEVMTQDALASSYVQIIGTSQTKVAAAKMAAAAGDLSLNELAQVGEVAQVDLQQAINGVAQLEQTAANDRAVLDQQNSSFTGLQARVLGQQLISDDLVTDAATFQQLSLNAGVEQLEGQLVAAEERLRNARLGVENADMRLDWAQARANQKKQSKGIKVWQPALDAANTELVQAQQAYDIVSAQLDAARHMAKPLEQLAQASGYEALSALQESAVLASQASVQGGWYGIAQARHASSSAVFNTAQLGVAQGTRALAEVQGLMAGLTTDPEAAQLLSKESERGLDWADRFYDLVQNTHESQRQTDIEQEKLDALTVQVAGLQTLKEFLDVKAVRTDGAYEQVKGELPTLEAAFQSAQQQSGVDRAAAEAAYTNMLEKAKVGEVDFILSRKKGASPESKLNDAVVMLLSQQQASHPQAASLLAQGAIGVQSILSAMTTSPAPVDVFSGVGFTREQVGAMASELARQDSEGARQKALTNADEFIQAADKAEMAKRKLTHKKLNWLSDKAAYVENNADYQLARTQAATSIEAAALSSQAALDRGNEYQAVAAVAGIQANLVRDTQSRLSEVASTLVDLAGGAVSQAKAVGQAASAERSAANQMLQGLTQYVDASIGVAGQFQNYPGGIKDPLAANLISSSSNHLFNMKDSYGSIIKNAETISISAEQQVADVQSRVKSLELVVDKSKGVAQQEQADLAVVNNKISGDLSALSEKIGHVSDTLKATFETRFLARAAARSMEGHADSIKELHEDRVAANQVYKKQKKAKTFMSIVNMAVMIAAAVAAIPSFGGSLVATAPVQAGAVSAAALGAMAEGGVAAVAAATSSAALAAAPRVAAMATMRAMGISIAESTAIFSAANAVGQGINMAAGWQDEFNTDSLLAAASAATFFAVASPVAQVFEKIFEGTILAVGRHALDPTRIVPQGSLGWLGKGIADGAGGVSGNLLQQGFDIATGRSDGFNIDSLKNAAALWGLGGAISHAGGATRAQQWPSVPGSNPLYLPFFNSSAWSLTQHIDFAIRRTFGITALNTLMYAMDLKKEPNFIDGLANGIAISFAGFGLARALPVGMFDRPLGQYLSKVATLTTSAVLPHLISNGPLNWDAIISTSWGWSVGITAAKMSRQYLDINSKYNQRTPLPLLDWAKQSRN